MVCSGNDSLSLSSLSLSLVHLLILSLSPSNSCLHHPHTCSISPIMSHTQTHSEVMDSIWKHVFTSISSEEKPFFRLFHTVRYHQSDMFTVRQGIFSVLSFISFFLLSLLCLPLIQLVISYKMHWAALITGVKSDSKSDSVVRARRMFVLKERAVPLLI